MVKARFNKAATLLVGLLVALSWGFIQYALIPSLRPDLVGSPTMWIIYLVGMPFTFLFFAVWVWIAIKGGRDEI